MTISGRKLGVSNATLANAAIALISKFRKILKMAGASEKKKIKKALGVYFHSSVVREEMLLDSSGSENISRRCTHHWGRTFCSSDAALPGENPDLKSMRTDRIFHEFLGTSGSRWVHQIRGEHFSSLFQENTLQAPHITLRFRVCPPDCLQEHSLTLYFPPKYKLLRQ